MKKFTGFIAAAAIALAPMSSSALEALTDNALNDVTGQAGVAIAVDDIVIETWVGTTTYTDSDGTNGTAGSLVISGKHTVKDFQGISSADADDDTLTALDSLGVALTNTGVDGVAKMAGSVFTAHALTIDVGQCAVLTEGVSFNNTGAQGSTAAPIGGVVIGLPTIEINTSSDTYTVGIAAGYANTGATGADYIQVTTGAKTQHILGGTIEIAPH